MSIKGLADVRCPGGCENEPAEVWSFVRGDEDPELRETLLAGELNLLLCERCGRPFYAETVVVYLDEAARLLAFIFPESYRADEARWRGKMGEDFARLRAALPKAALEEPRIIFGFEEIRRILADDDEMGDEVDVARFFCGKLGLDVRAVDRAFARARALPWELPSGRGKPSSRENIMGALKALLKANDRLEGYRRWLEHFEAGQEVPPEPRAGRKAI